ncbi:MAG: hypothetical protein JSV99_00515 [Planctomycetota bacterium]|nr:MAG: hypothetical protein JSV99_00515 [Planctomycetota bacterium]
MNKLFDGKTLGAGKTCTVVAFIQGRRYKSQARAQKQALQTSPDVAFTQREAG